MQNDNRKKVMKNKNSRKQSVNQNNRNNETDFRYFDEEQRKKDKVSAKKYVSKKRIKKRNRALVSLVIIVLIVIVLAILSLTVFFPINNIEIKNNKKYSSEQILSLIGVAKRDNLILASESRANTIVKAAFPYVRAVSFNRKFPFTLEVNVDEYSIFAQIKDGSDYLRIGDDGKVLEKTDKYDKNSTVIIGTSVINQKVGEQIEFKESQVFDNINEIINQFNSSDLKGITLINFENPQDVRVTYDDRIVMLLGSCTNLKEKLVEAKAIFKARGDDNVSGEMNLSRIPSDKNEASFISRELEDTEKARIEK